MVFWVKVHEKLNSPPLPLIFPLHWISASLL